MQSLRPYQTEALQRARQSLMQHRRSILVAPTGAGKTTIAAEIVRLSQAIGRRSLILAHRKELTWPDPSRKTLSRASNHRSQPAYSCAQNGQPAPRGFSYCRRSPSRGIQRLQETTGLLRAQRGLHPWPHRHPCPTRWQTPW